MEHPGKSEGTQTKDNFTDMVTSQLAPQSLKLEENFCLRKMVCQKRKLVG